MEAVVEHSLNRLKSEGKLDDPVLLWGIGARTQEIIAWLREHNVEILAVADNFKHTFCHEFEGVTVCEPQKIREKVGSIGGVLLAVNFAGAIRAQLLAYGATRIYNLLSLDENEHDHFTPIPYKFVNRSVGRRVLCYILAGYQPLLWPEIFPRLARTLPDWVDLCIASSGLWSDELNGIAEHYGWSYLSTERNQVSYIQNLAIDLHPQAELIFKFDEDIFISQHFFEDMLAAYEQIERSGEYRINFLVPVLNVNCAGYVTFIDKLGQKAEYEKRFGRAYRSRFSAPYDSVPAARWLWEHSLPFDEKADFFRQESGWGILDCYFNIGCIFYTRDRWLMLGRWPVHAGAGFGDDERIICSDGAEKDLAIYEVRNVLAGHLGFGKQKAVMEQFYQQNRDMFAIRY